jgi:hypothetical protein
MCLDAPVLALLGFGVSAFGLNWLQGLLELGLRGVYRICKG